MPKLSKFLQFSFPLTKKVVRDLRLQTIHLGDLLITGMAHMDPNVSALDLDDSRYTVEITSVSWHNTEVLDLLQANQMDPMLADIEEAAIQHASTLFTSNIAA